MLSDADGNAVFSFENFNHPEPGDLDLERFGTLNPGTYTLASQVEALAVDGGPAVSLDYTLRLIPTPAACFAAVPCLLLLLRRR